MLTLYRVSPIILIAHPATAPSGVWPRRWRGNSDGGADEWEKKRAARWRDSLQKKGDAAHGRLKFERVSEIAVRELPEIMIVPHIERQSEAEGVA